MVESSSSGSRGAEDSRPPSHIADVTDRREFIMQDMISHTGTSPREESQSHTGRDTDLLCSAVGSQSCSTPHGTQFPNGNAEREVSKSSHLGGSHLKGEPSSDSLHGALNVDSVLGVDSCPSVPLTSQSNSEVTEPPQDGGEICSIGSGHKSNPQNSVSEPAHGDEDASSSPDAEPYRKSSGSPSAAVTRSLRTFSSSSFHDNESTSLSPDDGEIFLTSDRPDGSKFMDVSLVSRNTYEISRRQSAPDNIPTTLSIAASGLTVSEKHGISEMFSRYRHTQLCLLFCLVSKICRKR